MKTYTRTTIVTNVLPNKSIYEDLIEKELEITREKTQYDKPRAGIGKKDMQTELSTYLDNLVQ